MPSGDYCLLQCDNCRSIFTDPPPADETLAALYATAFDYRWYQDHYPAKLKDARLRVTELRPYLGRKVLDYGGGVGYFSHAAMEAGLESTTFDPFLTGQAPPSLKSWDSVVSLHVLEHSNNPDHTIEALKQFLCPGGKLVLAVPNAGGLGYQRLGMDWVWAQPPLVHIFHFTAEGLQTLLTRHGFKNIVIQYHERWDANLNSDLNHFKVQRRLDALWGLRPFNHLPIYRRVVAQFNSWKRFRSLKKTKAQTLEDNAQQSELLLIASLDE